MSSWLMEGKKTMRRMINVVFQRTSKKCTKNYNARAQLLFCSLQLLFSDVPVAVVVVLLHTSDVSRPSCNHNPVCIFTLHHTKKIIPVAAS